jgi:DNA polymerase III gamma/tau subunit
LPCGKCIACSKCEKGIHPDVHILQKEEDSTMIKVDAVRSIKAQALVFPNEGSKSVFIIREAQLMNTQAQNALLKIFEEPSSHLCFILTCPSKSAFLDTIISRATVYSLGEEIIGQSTKDDKAEALASELMISLATENEFSFIKKTAVFQKDKKLFASVISAMIPIARDALVMKSGGKDLLVEDSTAAKKLAASFTQKKTARLLECLQEFSDSLQFSPNHNLAVTRLCSLLYSIKTN